MIFDADESVAVVKLNQMAPYDFELNGPPVITEFLVRKGYVDLAKAWIGALAAAEKHIDDTENN